tara:strand:+ start:8569 stop:9714 length:1146 start_codon:yes stop_codon:yes gene_type:complete
MALIIKDRVKETTTTTGTGNVALGGAVSNFVTFASVLSDSDTTYYAIVDSNNSDFEVGLGTYVSSGNTIARTTVLASSNSGSAVSLSSGSKTIFCAFPADKAVVEDANGAVSIENLQIDTNAIKSTNSNGNIQLFPAGTGFTELYGNTNAGAIRFNCESNSHGVTLKGPPHSASATYSLELPNADGSAGQLLKTDGSGKLAFTSSLPGITATASEINILDGVTATASEINILDGVTATTTEINYLDITTLGLTQASKAVTADANGVVSFDNGTIEEVTTVTSSSNAATINLRDGNLFEHDLTENVTYTFSNPAASGRASSFVLKVIQDSSARTITWPSSVDWPAATAPTLTATNNGVDVFVFFTIDGGTTYYGFVAGQAMG